MRLQVQNETVRIRASCELSCEIGRETPIVAMLRACPSAPQCVQQETLRVVPELSITTYSDVFGNRCDRFVAPPGALSLRSVIVADVTRSVAVDANAPRTPFVKLPMDALHFTLPSRYCPSDKLQALALEITRGCRPGYGEVQAICQHVHERLTYRYGVSNASTDALETLVAGAGVCRDFAHVAISLCRSIDIPARMAAGYLYQREPMDLHAWFEAHVGGRWYTFDPSERTLCGGRLVLAYGRDAADVAFLTDYGGLTLQSMHVAVRETALATARPAMRVAG
jgi:transglutaminase-like putative cysteine protease